MKKITAVKQIQNKLKEHRQKFISLLNRFGRKINKKRLHYRDKN